MTYANRIRAALDGISSKGGGSAEWANVIESWYTFEVASTDELVSLLSRFCVSVK